MARKTLNKNGLWLRFDVLYSEDAVFMRGVLGFRNNKKSIYRF